MNRRGVRECTNECCAWGWSHTLACGCIYRVWLRHTVNIMRIIPTAEAGGYLKDCGSATAEGHILISECINFVLEKYLKTILIRCAVIRITAHLINKNKLIKPIFTLHAICILDKGCNIGRPRLRIRGHVSMRGRHHDD